MIATNIYKDRLILKSLSESYNTIHLFDLKEGLCEEISAFPEVHDFFKNYGNQLNIQDLIHLIISKTTRKDYLDSVLEFTDFSTLAQRLSEKKAISFDFIGSIHGWTRCTFIPVLYDSDGDLKQVLYTTRIIQSDKEREEDLLSQVDYDELTHTYNRRAYERECSQLDNSKIPENFTVISFDVNNLNFLNHKFGVSAGDLIIQGAVDCIKAVFETGKIFRVGGDEFDVFIDCSYSELINLFGKFDSETASWSLNHNQDLTISKGCAAHVEFPEFSIRELQAKADQRMYEEKMNYYSLLKNKTVNLVNDVSNLPKILKKSYIGITVLEFSDTNKPKLYLDDNIKEFLGFPNDHTPEEYYTIWFQNIHTDYTDSVNAAIEKIILGNQTEVHYPWFHPKAGLIHIRSFGYRDPNCTQCIRIMGFFQNVTNLVHYQKDTLTGCYTKEIFYQKADEIISANPDKSYRFVLSDIENFKSVNDKYGIELADQLLQYISKTLRKLSQNLVLQGRINADVFVCMQEVTDNISDPKIGKQIQEQLLKNAPIQNFILKHGIYYINPDTKITSQKMCDRARYAAESIKGNYQVSCAIYNETLADSIKTKQQIVENMEDALKNKEFRVYLQPKHDLHTNKTGGAEALIRWIHPEIGFMNPGDFIPLFEINGFVKHVDNFVLTEVCSLLNKWITENKPLVPISVNLSRRDFETENLSEQIIQKVDTYNIPHKFIHFEVTESAFSDNPEQITRTIKCLHDNGFIIELDDFGSGYSSLTALSEIDFDILKLDMSIIRKDRPDTAKNVLDMCSYIVKQMKLKSVAEGVETESQLQRLKDIGCDYIQGYYFSKPLPIEEFEEYLKNEQNS